MTEPRVVAIVQARMGSSRLPGKVLADLGGSPVVAHLVKTAQTSPRIDAVVLAVPHTDSELVELGSTLGVVVVTGDEHDVLGRFHQAAEMTSADVVVRLTGDCPLLDFAELDAAIARFLAADLDYLTVEDFPRGTADIEIMTRMALDSAHAEATNDWHREHVCTFFPDHPDRFSLRVDGPPPEFDRPTYRLCVDQPEDLTVVREVHRRLAGHAPRVARIVDILDRDPELAGLNAHVLQVTRSE